MVDQSEMKSSRKLARLRVGRLLLLALLGPLLPTSAQAQAPARRVLVKQYDVFGNTLLESAALDQALAPFKGEHSFDELKQAAAAVQALYRQAGYGAVLAYLPAQGVVDGQVTIGVLEGRLSTVVVSGNSVFSEANIRRSLPLLQTGLTPQVRALDAQVRLANENPAKQIALTLEPGQNPGEVEAEVVVTEQTPRHWLLALDNTGTADTGRWRASLGFRDAALWDRDHQLSLQFQTAPDKLGAVSVYSADYRVPLYTPQLMFDAFAAYSDVDAGSTGTAAGPLQFNGRGRMWSLRLSRMLQRQNETDQRLGLSLNERAYLNSCRIDGLPAGACGPAGESVTVHPLTLDYSAQFGRPHELTVNALLSHNLPWGGAHTDAADFNAVRPGATRNYTTLRLGATGALAWHAWQLSTRLEGQWASQALVPGEQFGISGAKAVRGYEERELTGDQGAYASLELYGPELAPVLSERLTSARMLGFVDAGKVSNHLATPCLTNARSSCSLTSVGAGGRVSAAGLQWRLDLAHVLSQGNRTGRGTNRLHLLASYDF